MSKTLPFDPATLREKQIIKTPSIPVNQYQSDFKKELKLYGKDRLVRAYYDMLLIRKFETMLDTIKKEGVYQGISYTHKGPAHLSAGQESAAVGQAMVLEPEDQIFGSHRSHGEILAKSMSAIYKMEDKDLLSIMEGFMNGQTYQVIADHFPGKDVRDTAENFVLYGALAEIYAKKTGFNAGLGGSMHTFFKPFGSMPNNAIVGGSCTIAVGAALYKKINRKKGIVIANIGDGSLARGPVYEGLVLSSMDQYKTLWEENPGYPPFMLNCFDNLYAMGGQPIGETMGYKVAARVGAAINEYSMHTERVDGFNPLAVADATARKKELLLKGEGPAFLDTLTYRYSGHSPSDAMTYRTKEELEAFRNQDPIVAYGNYLIENGVVQQADLDRMDTLLEEKMRMTLQITADPKISPMVDEAFIESVMFSNGSVEKFDDAKPVLLQSLEENPRVQQIAKRNRYAYDENGKEYPAARQYQYRDAVFEAMVHRFSIDPTMIAYGEDHRDWGGAFACYRGLTELLPPSRFFNSPIAESAIVGSGVGYAMAGGRAVVELMYCDFLGCAGDEVFNQMPKWQAMSAGILKMPIVLRVSVGSKYGAQHSQDWTSLCAQVPGLKVVFPATPYDAKGLLATALNGTDPVLFFESQRIYDVGEQFHQGGVPVESYEIPFGEPDIKKAGKDLTILTIGATLYRALEAAKTFEEKYGISCEVIDARSMVPFNYDLVIESVKKTGKIIVAGDACDRGSFLSELARNIGDLCFDDLDAPVIVLGSRNWITPAFELENDFFPQPDWFIDVFHERIQPLPGYVAKKSFTDVELKRRAKLGV